SDALRTNDESTDRTIGVVGRRPSRYLSSPSGEAGSARLDTGCRASERVCAISTHMEETGQRRDKDLEARDARFTGSHMNGLHVRRAAALRSSGETKLVEKAESLFEARDQRKRYESQSRAKGGHDRVNLEGYCRTCREMHAKHGSAACPGWRDIARRFEAVPWASTAQIACYAAIERRAGFSYLYLAWNS
ncbi:hypothetical protein CCMA1212_004023, partial [Trichoderma ghanense]